MDDWNDAIIVELNLSIDKNGASSNEGSKRATILPQAFLFSAHIFLDGRGLTIAGCSDCC